MEKISYQACPICLSRGHVRCATCRGKGTLLNPLSTTRDKMEVYGEPSFIKCNICFGSGKVACNGCGGSGRILIRDNK